MHHLQAIEISGVKTFSCLFAFDPKTQEAKLLVFGMWSLEEVEGNIVLQFGGDEKVKLEGS